MLPSYVLLVSDLAKFLQEFAHSENGRMAGLGKKEFAEDRIEPTTANTWGYFKDSLNYTRHASGTSSVCYEVLKNASTSRLITTLPC